MLSEQIGPWLVEYDADATRLAYGSVAKSGPDERECGGCKNWLMAREVVYPREFLDLLDRLGVEPKKESEVYDIGEAPTKPNIHYYGGWFHFFGHVSRVAAGTPGAITVGDTFSYEFDASYAPGPRAFTSSANSCRITFNAEVPWLFSDTEYSRLGETPRRSDVMPKSDGPE